MWFFLYSLGCRGAGLLVFRSISARVGLYVVIVLMCSWGRWAQSPPTSPCPAKWHGLHFESSLFRWLSHILLHCSRPLLPFLVPHSLASSSQLTPVVLFSGFITVHQFFFFLLPLKVIIFQKSVLESLLTSICQWNHSKAGILKMCSPDQQHKHLPC